MAIVNSALAPFTLKGFYLLTWGTALGSNVWSALVSDFFSSSFDVLRLGSSVHLLTFAVFLL